jgi:hypothetical protein
MIWRRGIVVRSARTARITDRDRAAVQNVIRGTFRHCVALIDGNRWRCVDCGMTFDTWPSDMAECPGTP